MRRAKVIDSHNNDEEQLYITKEQLVKPKKDASMMDEKALVMFATRNGGNLHELGVFLTPAYDWEIVLDDSNTQVLIAMKNRMPPFGAHVSIRGA